MATTVSINENTQAITVTVTEQAGQDGQGIAAGGTTGQVLAKASGTDYDTEWVAAGAGDMIAANNLSDLADAATSRTNLGLGTAATTASTAYATAAQGTLAESAMQPLDPVSALLNDSGFLTEVEGTGILSTGETGGTKFLREDGDGTCSWQTISGGGDLLAANNLSDLANTGTARTNLGLGTAATAATGDFEAAGAVSTHAAVTSGVHGISAFGATLVDDADAATARTTLGLGTAATSATGDFAAAAHSHTLSDISDAGTAASSNTGDFEAAGAVFTHASVASGVHGISAFGATLVDDADAATARTTLGLGTAATSATGDFAAAAHSHTLSDISDAGTAAASDTGDFEAAGAVSTHAAVTSGVHGISAFGATLVDDADAATARTTLGLGTAATSASGDFVSSTAPFWVEVVLTASGADIAAGTNVAYLTHTVAGTITGFKIVCDPANEPSAAAVQVDLNAIDLSTGAATSRLSAVAQIATGANVSTGGTISGTQAVAFGDQSSFDIDQGSDGKELRALVQITPS